MEEEIHTLTVSEWKSVNRRLDDFENIVADLKLTLDTFFGNGNQVHNRNSNLETQNFDRTEVVVGVELNIQSNLASAAAGTDDLSGHSTFQEEKQGDRILTLTSVVRNSNSFNSTSTTSSSTNSTAGTSARTSHTGIPTSLAPTTLSPPNGINVEGQHEFEKSRRAVILLKRCDEKEAPRLSSSSVPDLQGAIDPSISRPVNHDAHNSCKERIVRQGGMRGQLGIRAGAPKSVKKEHRCPFCPKKFMKKYYLTTHMRTHTREKPFDCDSCSKTFSYKSNLVTHIMRVHTGVKPFECQFCPKKFSLKSDLESHLRVHTGIKSHECEYCSKKFSQRATMTRHTRVHTGVKPYECEYCPKKFSERVAMTRHTRVHTGVKPYECQFCQREFSQRSSMLSHLNTHTGEKPYSCPWCPKTFAHKPSLQAHVNSHGRETSVNCAQEN